MMPNDPTEPELGNGEFGSEFDDTDGEQVAKTGTTTVGVTTEDGVVIGTDRKASLQGRFTVSKDVVKVQEVHPTAALTLVGSVGGAQSFIDYLRSEAKLNEFRRSEPLSVPELAKLAGNFARGGPFFMINPILGGVDDEGEYVYSIDPAGGVMRDDYTVTGSGMTVAYGHLEDAYHDELSQDEAANVALGAVRAAAERDSGTGDGFVLADVTHEGVDITEYNGIPDEV